MYLDYLLEKDGLYIGGYEAHIDICKHSDVVKNYFIYNHRLSKEKLEKILNSIENDKLSILMNMSIDEEYRNKGFGRKLLNDLSIKSKSPILLICDISETPHLQSWYEKSNFQVVESIYNYPIMLKVR